MIVDLNPDDQRVRGEFGKRLSTYCRPSAGGRGLFAKPRLLAVVVLIILVAAPATAQIDTFTEAVLSPLKPRDLAKSYRERRKAVLTGYLKCESVLQIAANTGVKPKKVEKITRKYTDEPLSGFHDRRTDCEKKPFTPREVEEVEGILKSLTEFKKSL